jgi:hypothetical protein
MKKLKIQIFVILYLIIGVWGCIQEKGKNDLEQNFKNPRQNINRAPGFTP